MIAFVVTMIYCWFELTAILKWSGYWLYFGLCQIHHLRRSLRPMSRLVRALVEPVGSVLAVFPSY